MSKYLKFKYNNDPELAKITKRKVSDTFYAVEKGDIKLLKIILGSEYKFFQFDTPSGKIVYKRLLYKRSYRM